MNIRTIHLLLGVAVALLIVAPPVHADDTAAELLQKVAATTQATKTISAEYTNTISNSHGPYYGWSNSLKLLKPNFCRLDIRSTGPEKSSDGAQSSSAWHTTDSAVIVSDGKQRWQYGYRRNDYKTAPLDAQGKSLNLVDIRPLIDFFDPAKSWWEQVETIRREGRLKSLSLSGKESWEGAEYQVVQVISVSDSFYTEEQLRSLPGGVALKTQRFYIGTDTLIHRMTESGTVGNSFDYQLHNVKVGAALQPTDFAYAPPLTAKPAAPPPPLLAPGIVAPDFLAEYKNKQALRLSEYRGKIVVLDFWATWCQPCQKALPHLRKVFDAVHNQDVVFLALCVWDDRPAFDAWTNRNSEKYPFVFGFDPSARNSADSIPRKLYSVNSIPATYVLDREGKIAASFDDYIESDTRLEAALKKLNVQVSDTQKPAQKK